MTRQDTTYDAIVVGSGISGGWAAKELCDHGLKTLVLERGRNVQHIKDYPTMNVKPWELPHRGAVPVKMREQNPLISKAAGYGEDTAHFFIKDADHPYVQEKPFDWVRGYQVGGKSLTWGRVSLRWSDFDFTANQVDGHGVDWPIRYADIAPWYDHAERFAGISGTKEGLPQLPDGEFQPPMPLNCAEEIIAKRLAENFGGKRRIIPSRTANLTQPLPGRGACQYRDACWLGCPYGAYFSTQSSTLPPAMATGRLTLRPWAIVTEVLYDKDKKRATGVRVMDGLTNQMNDYSAKVVFLCASTLNSAWLLMRSATDVWPGGLGSSSGELGHNLMDHHFRAGAGGRLEGLDDKYYHGRRPNGFYIPRYRNLFGDKRSYLRGFGYQGGAGRDGWGRGVAELGVGGEFKDAMSLPGQWTIGATAFGEMLPNHANMASIDPVKKDKWGLPVLRIDCATGENEHAMRRDMQVDMAELLEQSGVKDVTVYDAGSFPGDGIHEMGTARMGRDPKTSVLNSHNQVWDAMNVFVTDGSCMVSTACQNPSLTYMALTARAADYAVQELKRQNL